MILRLLALAVVLVAAFAAVGAAQRWRLKPAGAVPAGLTLVTAPGCRDCVTARERFDQLGATYRVADISEAAALGVTSFTAPLAVVGSHGGDVLMVRRGSSVVADADAIVAAAASPVLRR
jgi:glutaredoxin